MAGVDQNVGRDAGKGRNKSDVEELILCEIHGFAESELKKGCTSQPLADTGVNERVGRQQSTENILCCFQSSTSIIANWLAQIHTVVRDHNILAETAL